MMTDLVGFITARLDEDEAAANALATGGNPAIGKAGQWNAYIEGGDDGWAFEDDAANGVGAIVGSHELAAHIARHDPVRVLREVAADRAILDRLEHAARYRDQVFARPEPRSVSDEMRAVTTMLTLEVAVKLRAAIYNDHPDYQEEWKP